MDQSINVIIMGAAGRDFHNFNIYYRDNPRYRVTAFTATQIPNIDGRVYPPELAGALYPSGIPIYPESELVSLIKKNNVKEVVFSYSDVTHNYVMSKASEVLAAGADFRLLGPASTMLKSSKPVIAVTAVRTGVGKSQTTRRVCDILRERGKKVVVVRHPMPYGDLAAQACQRYGSYEDLERHKCTIEEREEYEPHLDRGVVVYAGVDYGKILAEAEKEADVIVWDGGNNDFSFYKADLYITLVDPHRPGHELRYHPGETNLRLADVIVINKEETASLDDIGTVMENIRRVNDRAVIIEAASPLFIEGKENLKGKRVLVVEDGPTVTHGEMGYGAGVIAAKKYGAAGLVDPRPFAAGSIREVYQKYTHIDACLPAMGYGEQQVRDLEKTINASDADLIVIATPIDLRRIMRLEKPALRVRYELQELGKPILPELLARF
ncbi:MAG: GTPase [Firmicutes bacterium]|jgi:predicted GTPase|nr:GTPase [Bacillota bacterium]HPU01081.1 cyclic 2,3-diphosphoglycerate synthase [Bacillota bacterium]